MLARIALSFLGVYQKYIRSALPTSCRFFPSCSEYAKLAITKYGFFKGMCLALKRIGFCHPFSGKSGHDPLL